MNVFSKAITRIVLAGTSALAISTFVARPAWAALKYGTYELSQLAETSKMFECQALVVCGACFIGFAILVRKWQASEE
jgi:hypothetical protein